MFTPPIELNFNNTETKNSMFYVPIERAQEMVIEASSITQCIVDNYNEYRIHGTGKYEGKTRLDEGKVIKHYLTIAKNVNEWAYILFLSNILFEKVVQYHKLKNTIDELQKQVDNA